MQSYYTSMTVLVWVSLAILCVLVHENEWFSSRKRKIYYFTYCAIFLASLAEWAGVQLSGNESIPSFVIRIIKYFDYILTPIAGAALTKRMKLHNIWSRLLDGIIVFNIVFQTISLFTNWMIIIDEHNVYKHGSMYFIYAFVYTVVILAIAVLFLIYGKNFRKQNKRSLYLIMLLVLMGIIIQEISGGANRTAYVAMTLAAALMFIHSSEFSQQRVDNEIQEQEKQIKTDVLSGLLSRRAYEEAVEKYSRNMPEDLVIFSIDINGLKAANDNLGHEAGDELIRGAADCIEQVFGEKGSCYRPGGDEFVIFSNMNRETILSSIARIHAQTEQWKGEKVSGLSLSVGYAALSDHPDLSCVELLKEADRSMYKEKDEYYRTYGRNRRKAEGTT